MKLVLVGLYCGPLLTLIPPLTRKKKKKRVSGNRVSDFRVSGGPPVISNLYIPTSNLKFISIAYENFNYATE